MSDHSIDGDALALIPLVEMKDTLDRLQPGSSLRQTFESVVRVVAVELIAGAVPAGMSARESVRKGCDLLALLQAGCTKI